MRLASVHLFHGAMKTCQYSNRGTILDHGSFENSFKSISSSAFLYTSFLGTMLVMSIEKGYC